MTNLTTSFAGLTLKNPIIIGSSGLTDSLSDIKKLEDNGAAAVVLKSLFEEEIIHEMNASLSKMQASSFIYPETLEFYENNDLDEESTAKYLELIRNLKKDISIPVIASINCVTSQQWTTFPELIQSAGADALELNIFILPSDINAKTEEQEKIYFEIVHEVLKQISIPVIVKISPYFSNLGATIKKISETGAKGIMLFNRYYTPDFDIDSFEITSANVLSHPDDMYQSLRWIAIMSQYVSCDLGATTGLFDGESVIKQILAGAGAVEIVSAIYKNGPEYIKTILSEIGHWMGKKGFSSINDFKGKMSQNNSSNPAAYERIQFMKYFRGYN